jgi:Zn-dependent protease
MICVQCRAEIAPGLLACPSCHALVHADELKIIAAHAEAATTTGDLTKALEHWRRALDLLPAGSSQHSAIAQKINNLVRRVDAAESKPSEAHKKPKWANASGAIGVIGLLLWKFKFLVIFFLTKAKLLLLGLTKASTFFSMLLSMSVYWALWGWKFAAGIVVSIYIHEMGHVYRLSRYGIKATAPMFIPGLGARIRLQQYPASPHEEARVGLAGPIWGLGAAVLSYLLYLATDQQIFAAIARTGAWINLFNLLPVWQLDGSHAFKALNKIQRGIIAATMLAMWVYTGEGLLLILLLVAAFRTFQKDSPEDGDTPVVIEFATLLVTLSLLSKIPVHTGAAP